VKRPILVAVLASLAALTAATPAAAAKRQVPFGFMGVLADAHVLDPARVNLGDEMKEMSRTGVESVRAAFYWSSAQPYASFADVPPEEASRFRHEVNGVPTDFIESDYLVGNAAERGFTVLPVVVVSPNWAAEHPGTPGSPPYGPEPYAAYLTGLVERYGPDGEFWREHPEIPKVPVREWQLWNEPNSMWFWSDQPFAAEYVDLLKGGYRAVKAADPGARVVLAGLVKESWNLLDLVYRAGGKKFFDVVAIHPFTEKPENVMRILGLVRRTMRKYGDNNKRMFVSELTWPSSKGKIEGKYGYETTEAGQASRLRTTYRMLAANRRRLRLDRVYWVTWLKADKSPTDQFDYSGLRRIERDSDIVAKPAQRAYAQTARVLEGCVKSSHARDCR